MSLVSEGLEGWEGEDGVHEEGAHVVEQQKQCNAPGEGLQEDMENEQLIYFDSRFVYKYLFFSHFFLIKFC